MDKAITDERSTVAADVGRTHDPAVQHSIDAYIVNEDFAARSLCRKINAAGRGANHSVLGPWLERHILGQCLYPNPVADQFPISRRTTRFTPHRANPIANGQSGARDAKLLGRKLY